jgi:predicted flap endonuclease-1-like 5' DNA nuclease
MFVGVLLLIGGAIGWAIGTRPWEHFDDQSVPLYTGHHDDGHGAAHAAPHGETAPDIEQLGAAEYTTGEPYMPTDVAAHADHDGSAAPAALPPPPVLMDPMSAFPPAPTADAGAATTGSAGMPETAQLDDLTRIHGIGPKISRALYDAGINTFAQLAAQNVADLTRILNAANLRLTPNIDRWIVDAQKAATGDYSGLEDSASGD